MFTQALSPDENCKKNEIKLGRNIQEYIFRQDKFIMVYFEIILKTKKIKLETFTFESISTSRAS